MPQFLLEGQADTRDETILNLQIEKRNLSLEIQRLNSELDAARRENAKTISALRRQLTPLYQALRIVFGEMDAIGEDTRENAAVNPKVSAVWESWKQKLGGKQAEFIQALLEHGSMTAIQLKVATHTGTSTVPQVIYKLNTLGLIDKNGGKYSLKQL